MINNDGKIRDALGNDYHKPKDVAGENRYAFTSHSDSAFDVCFENLISGCRHKRLLCDRIMTKLSSYSRPSSKKTRRT
jgi:hypothetical protein